MRTTVKNILKSCGIVAVVALLAFAFFKPMEGNLEARTVAKDGKMYDILPKLPKEKAEKEEENEILGIGGGGYYIADANYTAPPNSHSAETTEANDKAWEQAKKDDEAAEEAENAKQEVAEKPLEIVKTPELTQVDAEISKPENIEVTDDGSINVTDKENADEDTDNGTEPSEPDVNVDKTDDIVVNVDEEGGLTVTDKNDAEEKPPVENPTEDGRDIIDIGTIPYDETTSEVPENANTSPSEPEIAQETTETTVQPEVLEEEVLEEEVLEEEVVEQPMEVVEVVVEW